MNKYFLQMMMERHKTDEAGVRKIMAERGKKGVANRQAKLKAAGKKHHGGFSNKKFAREMSAKAKIAQYGDK